MAQAVRARVQPTQVLAGLVGLAFVVFGAIGLVRHGFADFSGNSEMLGPFGTNPLHNLLYVIAGVIGLLLSFSSATSRLYGWIVLIGSAVLVAWGLMLVGFTSTNPVSELGNPLNLNIADNWLHVGTGVLGLIVAVLPARRRIVEEEPVVEPVTEPVEVQKPAVAASDSTSDSDTAETEKAERPRGLHRLARLRGHQAH
ncbi:DUF4383 domain-containing protein [Actinocrispum sp. NPDC049592]|uniref:DUF4383 domain-containing protein n=1 Tax=Actinocrispum sp. NPDC049592 TaxID=3154835 RepID=UPI00342D658C